MSTIDQQSLTERFSKATEAVQQLPEKPGNFTLLRLYALYKQATVGQAPTDGPSKLNFVERAKYDAWATLGNMNENAAKEQYIQQVNDLIQAAKKG